MNIRILLADDHVMLRQALGSLIAKQPGMTVIAEVDDGLSALRLSAELSPDVVIMDIGMPRLNGTEATRRIMASGSASKIIALSMHLDRLTVLNMLDAGASGYLLKEGAFEELVYAVAAVAAGRTFLSPQVIEMLVREYKGQSADSEVYGHKVLTALEIDVLAMMVQGKELNEIAASRDISAAEAGLILQKVSHQFIAPCLIRSCHKVIEGEKGDGGRVCLTDREKEVLRLIKDGNSTEDMAMKIGICQDTIKFHVKNIFQKLNTNSRLKAVSIAVENNLLDM